MLRRRTKQVLVDTVITRCMYQPGSTCPWRAPLSDNGTAYYARLISHTTRCKCSSRAMQFHPNLTPSLRKGVHPLGLGMSKERKTYKSLMDEELLRRCPMPFWSWTPSNTDYVENFFKKIPIFAMSRHLWSETRKRSCIHDKEQMLWWDHSRFLNLLPK